MTASDLSGSPVGDGEAEASERICGDWIVYRQVDCLIAECSGCKIAYDIGWAYDRYAGNQHVVRRG